MPCPLKRTGLIFLMEGCFMAIRHLVLMRLQKGVFTPEARQDYCDTFAALKINWILLELAEAPASEAEIAAARMNATIASA